MPDNHVHHTRFLFLLLADHDLLGYPGSRSSGEDNKLSSGYARYHSSVADCGADGQGRRTTEEIKPTGTG